MLHEKGITFYLDDFGTGYQGYKYSKPIPIHEFERFIS